MLPCAHMITALQRVSAGCWPLPEVANPQPWLYLSRHSRTAASMRMLHALPVQWPVMGKDGAQSGVLRGGFAIFTAPRPVAVPRHWYSTL